MQGLKREKGASLRFTNGNMQKTMEIQLRDYQKAASDKAVAFLLNPRIKHNGLIVIPTGGGKSWIIADIANRVNDNVLIFFVPLVKY